MFGGGSLFFLLVIALFPGLAAHNKGETFLKWYCYGVVIWIVAMPHSLILKGNR
jgi:type IV secretory pathway TrbD component